MSSEQQAITAVLSWFLESVKPTFDFYPLALSFALIPSGRNRELASTGKDQNGERKDAGGAPLSD